MASEQEVLTALANLVNNQAAGSMFQPQQSSARGGRQTSARDEKQRAKDAAKLTSNEVSAGIKRTLKVLPKELQKALEHSGNKLVKEIAGTTKNLQDVLRADDQIVAMKKIANRLNDISDKKFESQEEVSKELKDLGDIAGKAGITLSQLGIKVKKDTNVFGNLKYEIEDTEEVITKLKEAAEDYKEATDEARDSTEKLEKDTEKLSHGFSVFWRIIKRTAEVAEKETRFAMEHATADQGLIKGIYDLQISQSEYGKILADTRQEQFAMQTAGVDFNKVLKDGAGELRGFTNNSAEAAQVTALIIKNTSRMGVSQDQLTDAVDEQIKEYKKNARAYGMSAMAMAKLTENLLSDDDYRMQILRLRGKERAEFVKGIAQRQKEYKTMGYTEERAIGVQKALAALEGMNPKERYKKAAKQRAVLGALGMGQQGARLMQLETNLQGASETQKPAMLKEIAKIKAEAAAKYTQKTGAGSSIGTQMVFGQLADMSGLTEDVKTFQTMSGEGLKHQEDIANNTKEVPPILRGIVKSVDAVKGALNSGVGALGGGILSTLTSGITEAIKYAIMSSLVSKIGGKGLLGGVGNLFGGAGNMVKGGVRGAGSLLGAAGNMAMGGIRGIGNLAAGAGRMAMGPVGMVLGAGALGYGAGTLINNQLSDKTKENIGDSVGKVVDNVLSFFGDEEAKKRLDIMSGKKITNPATIANPENPDDIIRTDSRTARQKVNSQERRRILKQDRAEMDRLSAKKKAEPLLAEEQLKATRELTAYLKEINGANTEQAKAVKKTADISEKTLRFNSMPDRRT